MKIAVMCGACWYHLSDWMVYPLFRKLKTARGIGIGPIVIWDDEYR